MPDRTVKPPKRPKPFPPRDPSTGVVKVCRNPRPSTRLSKHEDCIAIHQRKRKLTTRTNSLFFCLMLNGWVLCGEKSNPEKEVLVFTKNGCSIKFEDHVASFHAPYLRRGIAQKVGALLGIKATATHIPQFGPGGEAIDLVSPEKGLLPGFAVMDIKEIWGIAHLLLRFTRDHKRAPRTRELRRWLQKNSRFYGISSQIQYLGKLLRTGDGYYWTRKRGINEETKMGCIKFYPLFKSEEDIKNVKFPVKHIRTPDTTKKWNL